MATTDFSRTPATQAPGWMQKYLDPSEELVLHNRFHPAVLLEPVTVLALGLVATAYADLAVRSSSAGRARDILVVVWVLWAAWALSTIWDYKTLLGFYKGSAVTRLFAFVATLALLACIAAAFLWIDSDASRTYSTGIGEQRTIQLVDGSTVELNARSRVKVRLTEHRRDVALIEGQALFRVAKDKQRPFVVRAGDAPVRAVGTEFEDRKSVV